MIKIKCDKDLKMRNIDEMQDFQGELKELSEDAKEKLKNSIVNMGFRIPIFMWKNKILDGHQRIEAITSLMEEGYTLKNNELPYIEILAKDQKEAKEMLLLISSRYGDITEEGVIQFITNAGIDYEELKQMIDLPEISDELFQDAIQDDEDEPEIKFTEELLESHNYLVLYFDNDIDWANAKTLFDLKTVQAKDSREGYKREGVGRVLRGVDAIQKIMNESGSLWGQE